MLSLAERNFSTVTDLADAMVRHSGLSFREAHHVTGGVVRMAMDQGLAANEITSPMIDQAAREAFATARATQAQGLGRLAAAEQRLQAAMREVA